MKKTLLGLVLMGALFVSCKEEKTTDEKVEEAVEAVGEDIEKTADTLTQNTEDALDNAAEKTEDALEK